MARHDRIAGALAAVVTDGGALAVAGRIDTAHLTSDEGTGMRKRVRDVMPGVMPGVKEFNELEVGACVPPTPRDPGARDMGPATHEKERCHGGQRQRKANSSPEAFGREYPLYHPSKPVVHGDDETPCTSCTTCSIRGLNLHDPSPG